MTEVDLRAGDASDDSRDADLVLSNVYGPLPEQLRRRPLLVSQFVHRSALLREWCGCDLELVSRWNEGREAVWCANTDRIEVDLSDLTPDPPGWFPLELPRRLLRAYARPGWVVWDGFMGRGTVGKACREMGLGFRGMDRDPERVEMARTWI